ncbi:MAG: hypothetical protein WD154_05640 [Nitrosopumilaceae archaeon]
MVSVGLSQICVNYPMFSYSIREIVDDFLRPKLDRQVREYVKEKLGIDKVFKIYDFDRIDFSKNDYLEPHIPKNELFLKTAKDLLKNSKQKSGDIGMLVTVNDNNQFLDPAPTVEIVSKLGLNHDVRTQNMQGLACSSFSEALLNSAGYFQLNGKSNSMILIGSMYTDWFLDRLKQTKLVSMKNKSDLNNLVYFLIFSDVVGGTILSKNDKNRIASIDSDEIFSCKDSRKNGYKKASLKLSPNKKNRIIFDMNLDSKVLKKTVGSLCQRNIDQLEKKTRDEYRKIKIWGLHTAGARFLDYITSKCNISKEKVALSYSLMKETGNTGAVSSLQFIHESIKRKLLLKNQIGCFIDYGWEGSNILLFKNRK